MNTETLIPYAGIVTEITQQTPDSKSAVFHFIYRARR